MTLEVVIGTVCNSDPNLDDGYKSHGAALISVVMTLQFCNEDVQPKALAEILVKSLRRSVCHR